MRHLPRLTNPSDGTEPFSKVPCVPTIASEHATLSPKGNLKQRGTSRIRVAAVTMSAVPRLGL